MRDPNRMTAMLIVLERVWKKNPDMRLGQLIYNIGRPDCFNVEDDEFMERMKEWAK